ncbi:MAG: hypothetical protein H6529_12995 [Nocardioides sp.]|nr:hypothetical protein [Nocardioides sp.]
MTTTDDRPVLRQPPERPGPVLGVAQWWPRSSLLAVGAVAVVAALARIPFLGAPLTSDEGGFLMVAAQWHPGTSLYGDYWVDRPPLLIALLEPVARASHQAVSLRLLGMVAVIASVLLAGRLGRLLGPAAGSAPRVRAVLPVLAAATAAVLLDSALFGGATEIDGELLGLPFVLASLALAVGATRTRSRATLIAHWAAAGATAAGALAVKQSLLDGFVAAGVLLAWLALTRSPSDAARGAVAFLSGALAAGSAVLLWAALHGTNPGPLWDAVVTFRAQAGAVISASAPSSNDDRAQALGLALLASGALGIVACALVPRRDRARPGITTEPDPRLLLVTVLGWELTGVALGGSYWLHYLIAIIPGLVLAVATAGVHHPRRLPLVAGCLVWALAVTTAADVAAFEKVDAPTADAAAVEFLAGHARPGDTAVVAFGDPALLERAGLPSPYPQLWSLPVRVRDPHLTAFTSVLESPQRPTWLIVAGTSLATWGVDSATAQQVVDREYVARGAFGDWTVYQARSNSPRLSVG